MLIEPIGLEGVLLELEVWLYELSEDCGCKLWSVFPEGFFKSPIGGSAQPLVSFKSKMPTAPGSGCCAATEKKVRKNVAEGHYGI